MNPRSPQAKPPTPPRASRFRLPTLLVGQYFTASEGALASKINRAPVKKVLLAWSSGKDSAWTLHALRQQNIEVAALLTTLNEAADRVAMHGVRRSLLELQAASIGLPVWQIPLPWPCTNDEYEARMADACRRAVSEGFGAIAFGDLYLQDVRAYRERQLSGTGLAPVFPLWELPTAILARDMIDGGLRARLSCIDTRVLSPSFAGREFDRTLLAALPETTDHIGRAHVST